jgi:3-oxoacyl-[acyl-carrier protein] reductase
MPSPPGPTATELFLEGKDQAAIDNLAKVTPLEHTHEAGDANECP